MIFLIIFLIVVAISGWAYALWVNDDWFKDSIKTIENWYKYCLEINHSWYEHCIELAEKVDSLQAEIDRLRTKNCCDCEECDFSGLKE